MTALPFGSGGMLRRFLGALGACENGLALIEFGMSLPVVLALGMYGLETANLAMAHLKVSNIAMITADSAGRVRDSIDEADLAEIFTGAKKSAGNLDFADHGRIILSSLEVNAKGDGQWIRWQRCDGAKQVQSSYGEEGDGKDDASLQAMGPPGNQIAAQPGTAVMVVEVVYDYQPVVSNSLLGAKTIRYVSAFNVRQRVDQVLKNAGGIAAYTCDKFNA